MGETLSCEGIAIPIARVGRDVQIESTRDDLQPMSGVVNAIRSGGGTAAKRPIQRRAFRKMLVERAHSLEPVLQGISVSHLDTWRGFNDDGDRRLVDEARKRWRAFAGADGGDDGYILGFNHEKRWMFAPRKFLLALIDALDDLARRA